MLALPVCEEIWKKAEHERKLRAGNVLARAAETMVSYESRLRTLVC